MGTGPFCAARVRTMPGGIVVDVCSASDFALPRYWSGDVVRGTQRIHPLSQVFRTRLGDALQSWSRDGGITWGNSSLSQLQNPNSRVSGRCLVGSYQPASMQAWRGGLEGRLVGKWLLLGGKLQSEVCCQSALHDGPSCGWHHIARYLSILRQPPERPCLMSH